MELGGNQAQSARQAEFTELGDEVGDGLGPRLAAIRVDARDTGGDVDQVHGPTGGDGRAATWVEVFGAEGDLGGVGHCLWLSFGRPCGPVS